MTAAVVSDFVDSFLADDFFAEDVTYTPNGGTAKAVRAVVFRKGMKTRTQRNDAAAGSQQNLYDVTVAISRDPTDGIETVTLKSDTISLQNNIGDAVSVFRVTGIMSQDSGCWYLGLTK
jgi:hypothetical protein